MNREFSPRSQTGTGSVTWDEPPDGRGQFGVSNRRNASRSACCPTELAIPSPRFHFRASHLSHQIPSCHSPHSRRNRNRINQPPLNILRPILIAVASLFVLAETAQAHYDPNIGRWISRDPIGEDGGLNVYGMLENDSVNDADFLGLAPASSNAQPSPNEPKPRDCASIVRAGHGWHTSPGGPVEKGAPKNLKKGDRCTAVSCFAGDVNKRFQGAVPYQGERFDDPNVPDYIPDPANPNKQIQNPREKGFLPGDQTAYTALEEAIKAVKAQAEKDCGPCCKSITVTVQCPGEAGGLDFQALTSRLNKPVLCGKTYTYDCKEKKWK